MDVVWDGPNAFQATTMDIGSLVAGNYITQLTDANGCMVNASITLTQPAVLTATNTLVEDIACFGDPTGIAQVVAAGGTAPYTFQWNTSPVQNTANAADLPAGEWTCTISDSNGCSFDSAIDVTGPRTTWCFYLQRLRRTLFRCCGRQCHCECFRRNRPL